MQSLRIGITGPIADKNLGDYAMFINNLLELGPSHRYVAFTYDKEFLGILKECYLQELTMDGCDVRMAESNAPRRARWRRPLRRCRSLAQRCLGVPRHPMRTFETPLELLRSVENYDEIRSAIESLDVLVVSGGGYLNRPWYGRYGQERLFRILVPVLLADALSKKIVFTGNTYGPFDDAIEFFRMNLAPLKDAVFGHRDDLLSPANLRALGIAPWKMRSVPDDLSVLRPELKNSQAPLPDGPYIILESCYPLSYVEKHVQEVKAFVEGLYAQHGVKTLFVPFTSGGEGEIQGRLLERHIDASCFQTWSLEGGFLRIDDAYKLISGATMLVTNRYHGVVLAVSAHTPVVNMLKDAIDYRYYYTKIRGFLDKVFEGIGWDDRFLIRTSMLDAFSFVSEDFDRIREVQGAWTSAGRHRENVEVLTEKRLALIHGVIAAEHKPIERSPAAQPR